MNGSLEQNRLAILTKIRLSRASYKNILTGDTKKEQRSNDIRHCFGIPNFPKSITLRFIDDHALILLAATGLPDLCRLRKIKLHEQIEIQRPIILIISSN
jgi:hypothetical protein